MSGRGGFKGWPARVARDDSPRGGSVVRARDFLKRRRVHPGLMFDQFKYFR
jgi:hypothetical protein